MGPVPKCPRSASAIVGTPSGGAPSLEALLSGCYGGSVLYLDPQTLVVVSAVASLGILAVMSGVGWAHRVPAGFRAWQVSQLAIALGSALFAFRGTAPAWASVVLANVLILAGLVLTTEGFIRFYGVARWLPGWVDVALIVVAGCLLALWSDGTVALRVAVSAVFAAFFLIRTCIEPMDSAEARRSTAQRVVVVLCGSTALFLLARAAWALNAMPTTSGWREGWSGQAPGLVLTSMNVFTMYCALYLSFARYEREMRAALQKVKMLSGLLPICSHCHKIRNDQGYWSQLELFIAEHSEAQFTHSICPTCLEQAYPESDEHHQ